MISTRDKKLKEYLLLAKKFIPGIKSRSVFSMYNPDITPDPTSAKIELSEAFINEKALSKGKILFAHYTSLRSAMNILNSGKIRLYNCFNLNDSYEIKYLLDKSPIEFNHEEIEQYKREHFILSGSLTNTDDEEDYNLWRLYADNCRGVVLVFEIDDKVKKWKNIFLQEVNYEKDHKSWIYDFLNFHKDFNEKHQLFQNKPTLFALLATGVKNEIWSIEKEFRIVIRNPFDKYVLKSFGSDNCNTVIADTLKHEYNSKGKLVSYVEIPLQINDRKSQKIILPFSKKEFNLKDYVPNLKIKKIILGPDSPFKEKSDFFNYTMWIQSTLKYDFEVSISKFKEPF